MDLSEFVSPICPVSEKRGSFKILFVGDAYCGKTRAIQTFLKKTDPKVITHAPTYTVYEYDFSSTVTVSITDVRGTTDIAKASECFKGTHVAVFFYAINNVQSLDNLRYLWIPRFRMYCGFEVPTILVGNKRDMRASGGLRSIASMQPESVQFIHGMNAKNCCQVDMFLECSAEDPESIDCLFEAAYSYVL